MRTLIPLLTFLTIAPALVLAQERIGDFSYTEEADPISGARILIGTTRETDSPSRLRTGSLSWSCNDGALLILLGADEFLDQRKLVRVQWRFDQNDVVEEGWMPLSTGTVLRPEYVQSMVIFTDQAKAASQLAIRVYDFQGTPHTYLFSMQGVTATLRRLPCVEATLAPIRRLIKKPGMP